MFLIIKAISRLMSTEKFQTVQTVETTALPAHLSSYACLEERKPTK